MKADRDLVAVTSRLRRALAATRGRLRVDDAILLAGFKRRSQLRSTLVGRAMRRLGWERGRYRFDGDLGYAYARGSSLEREVVLDVERRGNGRLVVVTRSPDDRDKESAA